MFSFVFLNRVAKIARFERYVVAQSFCTEIPRPQGREMSLCRDVSTPQCASCVFCCGLQKPGRMLEAVVRGGQDWFPLLCLSRSLRLNARSSG